MNEAIENLNRMTPEDRGHWIAMVRHQAKYLTAVGQENDRLTAILALETIDRHYPQPRAPQTCGPCCNC